MGSSFRLHRYSVGGTRLWQVQYGAAIRFDVYNGTSFVSRPLQLSSSRVEVGPNADFRVRRNAIVEQDLKVGEFTVANINGGTPNRSEGSIAYVNNGAAGSPILAFYDGTNWLRSDTGTAISAS